MHYAESDWDDSEFNDQDVGERLAEMAMEDDPNDFDWVPAKLRGKQTARKTYSLDQGLILQYKA